MHDPHDAEPTDAQLLAAALACMDKGGARARTSLLATERAHNARLAAQVIDRVVRSPTSRLIEISVDGQLVGGAVRCYCCRLFKAFNGARWFECSANNYRYRWTMDELPNVAAALASLCHVGIFAFVPRKDDTYSVMQGISLTGSPSVWMQRVTHTLTTSDKGQPWTGRALLSNAQLARVLLDMSVARRYHSDSMPRDWWSAAGDTDMAGPLARFAAFLARIQGAPADSPRIECATGSVRKGGAESILRAFLLFADRVFASADMAAALKLHEPHNQEDNSAGLVFASSSGMRLRAPTQEPKDITSNETNGADEDETLLGDALGCREWDDSIDADRLAHIARAHDAAALKHYLDGQVFPWPVLRGVQVVEVCGDRDDTADPKLHCSAYLRCDDGGTWWLATRSDPCSSHKVLRIAAPMSTWLADAVIDVFVGDQRHGFVGPSWSRDSPVFGWTCGWISRVANALCLRAAVVAGAWTPALVDAELQLARSLLAMAKRRRHRPDLSASTETGRHAQSPLAAVLAQNTNDIGLRFMAEHLVTRDVAQKSATEDMLRTLVTCLDRLQRAPAVFELVTKPYEAVRLAGLRAGDARLADCSPRFLPDDAAAPP